MEVFLQGLFGVVEIGFLYIEINIFQSWLYNNWSNEMSMLRNQTIEQPISPKTHITVTLDK